MEDVITWITEAIGISDGGKRRMITNSFLISADNAHGIHPNYESKADPTNQPLLNGGIVLKFHGVYTISGYWAGTVGDAFGNGDSRNKRFGCVDPSL